MPLNATILRQLETLTLDSRRKFLGQRHGLHRSVKRGQGLEFSDYRQYEIGDDPRHIDWGIYGRSDRLYVKRFLEDQDLSGLIILDASGSMTVSESSPKWRFARALAEATTYVALMSQDSIRLVIPGAATSPRFIGPRSFYSAEKFLNELPLDTASLRTGDQLKHACISAAGMTRFPGVALVISDCLFSIDHLAEAMSALRARNLEINLIQILDSEDTSPLASREAATIVDNETGEEVSVDLGPASRDLYTDSLNEHLDNLEKYCAMAQIRLVRTILNQPADALIIPTLRKTGLVE